MTQEDKELLLRDICARLPYGVKCKYYDICEGAYDEGKICGFERQEYVHINGACVHIEEVKPYLFPMSSMTEEQDKEFALLQTNVYAYGFLFANDCNNMIRWLDENNFDHRGLIPKGRAIDATNLNIY